MKCHRMDTRVQSKRKEAAAFSYTKLKTLKINCMIFLFFFLQTYTRHVAGEREI